MTCRVLGLELIHLEIVTDDEADDGYDHEVGSTAVDAEPSGALGFTTPGVEVE